MKVKVNAFLIFFQFIAFTVTAQAPKDMAILLAERDKLYKDYIYYNNQKSSFWGTQSKKDLRQIIDVLQGIITKDSEIVEAVRVHGLQKESSYIGQSREITDRVYNLNEEIEKLTLQLTQQRKKLAETQESLEEAQNSGNSFKILSVVLALAVAGLIFYIRKIR